IRNELQDDIIERVTKIEESEDDYDEWKRKIERLEKDFIKRVEIEELAKDPENLKIKITEENLQVDEDLNRLIGNTDKKKIKIIAGKLLNYELAILSSIGIFIFHLNKNGKLTSCLHH